MHPCAADNTSHNRTDSLHRREAGAGGADLHVAPQQVDAGHRKLQACI